MSEQTPRNMTQFWLRPAAKIGTISGECQVLRTCLAGLSESKDIRRLLYELIDAVQHDSCLAVLPAARNALSETELMTSSSSCKRCQPSAWLDFCVSSLQHQRPTAAEHAGGEEPLVSAHSVINTLREQQPATYEALAAGRLDSSRSAETSGREGQTPRFAPDVAEVTVLGTGAASPSKYRNVTGVSTWLMVMCLPSMQLYSSLAASACCDVTGTCGKLGSQVGTPLCITVFLFRLRAHRKLCSVQACRCNFPAAMLCQWSYRRA